MVEISTDSPWPEGDTETESSTDGEKAAPKGMERRLVIRLLTHWRILTGDRDYPSFSDFDPASIPEIWNYCFVLEIDGHMEDPVFRATGLKFAEYSSVDLRNLPVSQAPRDSLIEKSVDFAQEVVAKQVPISRGGEFFKPDGVKVLYRSIILPMSDDGVTINGLLGAANCREEVA